MGNDSGDEFDWSEFDEMEQEMEMMAHEEEEEDGEEEPRDALADKLKDSFFGSAMLSLRRGIQSVFRLITGYDAESESEEEADNAHRFNPFSKEAREARDAFNKMNREIK